MDSRIISVLPALMVILLTTHTAFAGTHEQNYSVGFADGCRDGKANSSDAFNGHENAAHHTQAYIDGYNAGYNQCSTLNSVDLSHTTTVNQAQYQAANPNYSCFTLIGNCGHQNTAQNQDQ
jgi:hypothetical protein